MIMVNIKMYKAAIILNRSHLYLKSKQQKDRVFGT